MEKRKCRKLVYQMNLEELHRARLEQGLSIGKLATAAGVCRSVIYEAMNGGLTAERSIIKIAAALGLPTVSLIVAG